VQNDRFTVAQSLAEISDAVRDGKVPVWARCMIAAMRPFQRDGWRRRIRSPPGLRSFWARLCASQSVDVEEGASLDDLAARGVVDPVMPSSLRAAVFRGPFSGLRTTRGSARFSQAKESADARIVDDHHDNRCIGEAYIAPLGLIEDGGGLSPVRRRGRSRI
jgi:hypothetical protein